ncbi:MAG: hypothetical protein ACRCSG_09040 [Cellulosilyticaceae bacterium]
MGRGATGGGLHGKDLSKADVAVNIFAFITALTEDSEIEYSCSIGDETINDIDYSYIVKTAKQFIDAIGGFERLAE